MLEPSGEGLAVPAGWRLERFHVELTNRCNFRCEFCPQGSSTRPPRDMEFELFERLVRELAARKLAPAVAYHVLGEPLLHPELPRALCLTREVGLRALLTTNGSLLTPERAEEIGRTRPHFVAVSLQTPDAPSFRLRGAPGTSFEAFRDRILAGVRSLLAFAPDTRVSLCLLTTPLKWAFFPATRGLTILDDTRALRRSAGAWAEELRRAVDGTHRLFPQHRVARDLRRLRAWRQNRLDLSERLSIETRIAGDWGRRAREERARVQYPAGVGTCHGLREHAAVLSDGTYAYCCTDYDGRTSGRSARDLDVSAFLDLSEVAADRAAFERWRVRNPACRHCLGGPTRLHRFIRQAGSIFYLGLYRRWLQDPLKWREP